MRKASLVRKTKETDIQIKVQLDELEKGKESNIQTGIGFFDHMLTVFAFYSGIYLDVSCEGDLYVDGHHTVEDIGIMLGRAIFEALGDKMGIARYGNSFIPMDEALVQCSLDISARPYLVFNVEIPGERVGEFETELTEEFFRAVAVNSGMTLHFNLQYGKNTHHIIEGLFKSFGSAFKQAIKIDENNKDKIVSSKGVI